MKHPQKNITKRVAVVGCKETTQDLIIGLEKKGFEIDHCITISPEKGKQQQVAGYTDLRPFCLKKSIPVTIVETYSLKESTDRERIQKLDLDMLLVMGWQRLIPEWFLNTLSVGAFGMHGSSKPLPHGRGRSPINWSLIQGKEKFYTHLFQYKPGVDDGNIVGVQTFGINKFDSCLTLHFKNLISMIRLCVKHIPPLLEGNAKKTPQPQEGASYYPKRTAEDGLIYWNESTENIYNLIRAVTRPFPGAFTYLENNKNKKILIWSAQPFDFVIHYKAEPGEIVEVFCNNMYVVKTKDGALLITESEGEKFTSTNIGKNFGTLNTPKKQWDLPK
jgi:methionyl-tRNA formyltransferase